MNVVIYQSFIIHTFVLVYGVHTFSVVIEGSKVGLIGENGTQIECSYTHGDYTLFSVSFLASNKSSAIFETMVTYNPDQTPTFNTNGQYLQGRVTLTPITQSSRKAVMTFNKLECIDETFYKCQVVYQDSIGIHVPMSNSISILVQVPPSKPDGVALVHTPADSSVITTNLMDYSSSSPSTAVTSKEKETVSASHTAEQNTTKAFNHSTIQTTHHNTTSSTPSNDDLSSKISYRTTTYSTQQTTIENVLAEGDNITVVCTGNVGKPPAEHIFKKYRDGHRIPLNYTANKTSILEISDNCSNYRTSTLTFQVTAQDNNAIIQCVVYSPLASDMLYVETAPIKVYYQVSMPTIILNPNKTDYVVGLDSSIHFICKSDGNPKPNYIWYKENNNEPISESENFTITDLNKTDSGMYTCQVSNSFSGGTYKYAANVRISIIDKADISTTQSSSTGSSAGVSDKKENIHESLPMVPVVVGVSVAALFLIAIIFAITYFVFIRKNVTLISKNESKRVDGYESKPITEPMTGNYDFIALEEDVNKTQTVDNGQEAADIREHNEEYLKKLEEEEQKKNESNSSPQPAVYAQVNEATKSKNKQNTETPEFADKQEEGTYAETQEGIYDKAGDRRHKENENDEHFDTSNISSQQNSNSQIGSYNNQAFENDENRKVATVSPIIRSSGNSQDDEQAYQNRHSQSKEGYEHVIANDQTDISKGETSHRTAL